MVNRIGVIAVNRGAFYKQLIYKQLSQLEIPYLTSYHYIEMGASSLDYDALEIWGLGRMRSDYHSILASFDAPVNLVKPPLPLDTVQYLLVQLAQEASEVAQAATKCLMFSMEDQHPEKPQSNLEALEAEVTDLLGILALLREHDVYIDINNASGVTAKKHKTEHYMKYAARIGTLQRGKT